MDDDGGLTPNSSIFGDIDIDIMDQLLDDGCWLQTADVQHSPPSTSDALGFPSDISLSPALEGSSTSLASWLPQPDACHQEFKRWDLGSTNTSCIDLEAEKDPGPQSPDQNRIEPANQINILWEGSEQKRIWIAPKADAGSSSSVKDRLMMAVRHFQSLTREGGLLIQIWVPVRRGIKNFLTTVEQPYSYDANCAPLVNYRNVSEGYQFSADEDSTEDLGLPGRVFLGKVPEWTPDVRFFRQEEYPRVKYALMCDVRGSVALPVFERGSGNCLGVVEIVATSQKINYRPEVESLCKALEAVNLRSSEIISPLIEKGVADVYDIELSEISRVIRTVCDKHNLPLSQTWAPCTQHRKGGCWRLDKNTCCISTIDTACYVRDQRISGFHDACSEQHLYQDQGTVGKTFMTSQPCYVVDVTEYSRGEYPLSHHAKMFGLRGAIAMHLRCKFSGWKSYILEFFLPIDSHDPGLTFHFEVMESLRMEVQGCHSLCFPSLKEFEQEVEFVGKDLSFIDGKLGGDFVERAESPSSEKPTQEEKSPIPKLSEVQRKGKSVALPFKFSKAEPIEELNIPTHGSNNEAQSCKGDIFPGHGFTSEAFGSTGVFAGMDGSSRGDCSLRTRKKAEKKRTKAQKSISLQVLKQYFSGSLKDAAKSIGVCPTTLKRVCRHHGITRWPSRKIKKVDHSLRKLQLVIDSVQGARGSIQLSSFYSNFPELSSPTAGKINDQPEQLTPIPESTNFSSGGTSSNSTSSSQTSSSSHSFAAGVKTSIPAANASGGGDPSMTIQDSVVSIKRARSEAQLRVFDQKASTVLERLQSNRSLGKHSLRENLPPVPREGRNSAPREGLVYKVKVTFGEENIRLKLSPNMGFGDLHGEIAARFSIGDMSRMQIKYLDDDKEWVLLTCDDDLEECVDIQRSFGSHTVRLLVHQATPSLGGSFGSGGKS